MALPLLPVCGLAFSSLLLVFALGPRWPVLLAALLPCLAGGGFWWRRHRSLTASAIARGDLLDSWVFQQRLRHLGAKAAKGALASERSTALRTQLEEVHQLAVRCAALDPTSTVSLLLMLEAVLDRLRPAAGAAPSGLDDLARYLGRCRHHLAAAHEEALRVARCHPGQPVLLTSLPDHLLP
jgi:hypothetical protein